MLGARIGNYRIVAKIGEGGMGAVYRAAHDTLGRCAAVKMLLPSSAHDREMVARLFDEARSATAIRHPGIVEIYDVGMLPDRTAYIIMELLEGESLAERLRRGPGLPYLQVLHIVRAVARTLHAAHERGVVHCDLKPDNIFLTRDPEMPTGERIKLLDFGIAKRGEHAQCVQTATGIVMGTPAYMSPEQCQNAPAIDRRADLYALGCVLYELLCGRPPFWAGSASEVMAHHLYVRPEPPRIYDEHIPEALEALVLRLLQKNPERRPATAAQVVAAIDDIEPAVRSAPTERTLAAMMDHAPTVSCGAATAVPSTTQRTGRRACPRPGTARQGCRRWPRRRR